MGIPHVKQTGIILLLLSMVVCINVYIEHTVHSNSEVGMLQREAKAMMSFFQYGTFRENQPKAKAWADTKLAQEQKPKKLTSHLKLPESSKAEKLEAAAAAAKKKGPPPLFLKVFEKQKEFIQQQKLKQKNNQSADRTYVPFLEQTHQSDLHPVGGLSCKAHGGPDETADADSREVVSGMTYWRDIPMDSSWKSPLTSDPRKFLTFEPDEGGYNNIRMAFETAAVLAVGTGRTLVLPPAMNFYLLSDPMQSHVGKKFGFSDFYDLVSIAKEQAGLQIITFQEFLEEEAMKGKLMDSRTGKPAFPPFNLTNWDSGMAPNFLTHRLPGEQGNTLWHWMRKTAMTLDWKPMECVGGIPAKPGPEGVKEMMETWKQLQEEDRERAKNLPPMFKSVWRNRFHSFDRNPAEVDGSPLKRLSEMMAQRNRICVYNETMQEATVLHVLGDQQSGSRMLVHFYAFLFFQNWKEDLWTKRFVRDHLRYKDEIQCAAARIVQAVRAEAREVNKDPSDSHFYTMHIRRGDFQFKAVRDMTAEDILYNNTARWIEKGKVLYIATDERSKAFFQPFQKHYKVLFLDDFKHLLEGVDSHYLGMIDQLVAAQGKTFVGVFFSTFTGYINRIRGYLSQKRKLPGYTQGTIDSYYYVPKSMAHKRNVMQQYQAVEPAFWNREFPVSWRYIDHNVDDHQMDPAAPSKA